MPFIYEHNGMSYICTMDEPHRAFCGLDIMNEQYKFLSYKKQTHKMGKICLLKINIKLNDYK